MSIKNILMVIINTIQGNLLEAKEDYIAQQCNCITCNAHGLSQSIIDKWPHGDPYGTKRRDTRNKCIKEDRDKPGTIRILKGKPNIICIFGQWGPGKAGGRWSDYYPLYRGRKETAEDRLKWFKKGIRKIEKQIDPKYDIAIPYRIGCGLAGGKWSEYKEILEKSKSKFVMYQL